MSDHAQIVVDIDVSAEHAPELANVVRAWLVGQQIIEQEESDSVLGGAGHRPGINFLTAIQAEEDHSFLDHVTNGVEIAVGRRVFDGCGNGIELQCDACGVSFEPDDSWYDAVGVWFDGDDLANFACPSCGRQALLTAWRGPWPWGFGNLGVTFWNWPPLSDRFLAAMTKKLGHRTVIVRLHL